jgi:(1->4)-alpha-D-glucan 1-alpha-D-glucosylmutase
MLYQALLGAWPVDGHDPTFPERVQAYALKAAREGKQETSWLNPNAPYETGLRTFITRILDPSVSGEFLTALETAAQRLALLGALNSLSQIALKATLPGVPDFYQGTELWDLSLVDPDNRRPVDFAAREKLLAALDVPNWPRLAETWRRGEIKFAWMLHLFKLRNELAEVFTHGDYQPLEITGAHRDHILAFVRRRGRDAAITVVAKSLAPFSQGGRYWPRAEQFDGMVDARGFVLDGIGAREGKISLSSLFAHFPAAVLKARTEAPARRLRQRASA